MNPNELIDISKCTGYEFEDLYNQLVALQKSVENGTISDYSGICCNLPMNWNQREILRNAFRSWDEFSGRIVYPVPMEGCKPEDAYENATRNGNDSMWNPHHPYGAARLRLLQHCIYYMKKCIDVKERLVQERLVRI